MFVCEWDKENGTDSFSNKDLSKIWNAMSEDISSSKCKNRQDVSDSLYTKKHSLLDPEQAQPSWRS